MIYIGIPSSLLNVKHPKRLLRIKNTMVNFSVFLISLIPLPRIGKKLIEKKSKKRMEFKISIKKKTKKHSKIGPGMLYSKSINIFNHIHRDSI